MRPLWRPCLRGGFQVRSLRRARGGTRSAEERREQESLRRQARNEALRGLRGARGPCGEVRTMREAFLALLGRAQGTSHLPATIHRGRTRHGRRARTLGLLGGGRDVPRLRKAFARGDRNYHGRIRDDDLDGYVEFFIAVNFPGGVAAKLLILAIRNAKVCWYRPVDWTAAMGQFSILFEDRFPGSAS